MKKNSFILEEGYKKIAIVFTLAIVLELFISDCLGTLSFIALFFLLYIYRGSNKHIFSNTQSVLAPIDATVSAIDIVHGKTKIYCKVGLLNNHILRAPEDAQMRVKKFRRGLNLNPNSFKASLYNEQVVVKFDTLKIKLISGLCNHKLEKIYDKKVEQGEKITVFLDGLVIITLPEFEKPLVNIGDKLISGQTILFKK